MILDWPLGFLERPRSEADLLLAELGTLREWLRLSVMSWVHAETPEKRVRSFSPLTFLSDEEPDRQLTGWAESAPADFRLRLEQAITDTIETIALTQDLRAATIAVRIGARFNCKRPLSIVTSLLSRPMGAEPEALREFARAIAHFSTRRLTSRECRDVAYMLRDANLGFAVPLIDLLINAAIDYDVSVIQDMEILTPILLVNQPATDDPEIAVGLQRYWANNIVETLKPGNAFRFALEAQRRNLPELRETLEAHRLRLSYRSLNDPSRALLIDKISGTRTHVDLSAFQADLIRTPGSEQASDKRFAKASIDRDLGLEPITFDAS